MIKLTWFTGKSVEITNIIARDSTMEGQVTFSDDDVTPDVGHIVDSMKIHPCKITGGPAVGGIMLGAIQLIINTPMNNPSNSTNYSIHIEYSDEVAKVLGDKNALQSFVNNVEGITYSKVTESNQLIERATQAKMAAINALTLAGEAGQVLGQYDVAENYFGQAIKLYIRADGLIIDNMDKAVRELNKWIGICKVMRAESFGGEITNAGNDLGASMAQALKEAKTAGIQPSKPWPRKYGGQFGRKW